MMITQGAKGIHVRQTAKVTKKGARSSFQLGRTGGVRATCEPACAGRLLRQHRPRTSRTSRASLTPGRSVCSLVQEGRGSSDTGGPIQPASESVQIRARGDGLPDVLGDLE